MKKYFLFLLVAIIALLPLKQSLAASDQGYRTIKVAAFQNYPLIFKDDNGIITGMYVDLLTKIGEKEHINFQYVFGSWNEGLDRIKSGEIDLLTSVGYTEDRSLFMDYTKNQILTVWGELYVSEWSGLDSILKVSDKTIGVMAGDINAGNFKKLIEKFNITCKFVEFSNYDEVFGAVNEKRVDAGVAGVTYGNSNTNKYNLKSSGVVFYPLNLYFTVAKGKNQDVISILDNYLASWEIDDNSFLNQSKEKWMSDSFRVKSEVPTWFYGVLAILGFMLLVALVFVIILSRKLKKKNTEFNRPKNDK